MVILVFLAEFFNCLDLDFKMYFYNLFLFSMVLDSQFIVEDVAKF